MDSERDIFDVIYHAVELARIRGRRPRYVVLGEREVAAVAVRVLEYATERVIDATGGLNVYGLPVVRVELPACFQLGY